MHIGYRKIWRDLWRGKGRTLLAVLSITVGVFAVGLVASLNDILPAEMTRSYRDSQPTHILLYLRGTLDDAGLKSLSQLPGVAGVEGESQYGVRWRLDPNTPWRDATVIVRDHYADQQFDRIELLDGHWPDKDTLVIEHRGMSYYAVPANGSVMLQINDREHTVQLGGSVRDLRIYPPQFGGVTTFFMSRGMAESLFGTRDFYQVKAHLTHFSQPAAEEMVNALSQHLEKSGLSISSTRIRDPNRHFNQEMVDSVMLILGVLAILSLGLGLFLVINTINAIIAQQIPQIGAMKAIGATTGQVTRLYLAEVAAFGVIALLIAVPAGAVAANAVLGVLLGLLNIPAEAFRLSQPALMEQFGTGLVTPILAALWPVVAGTRVTVREAIGNYGIESSYGRGLFDRALSRIRGLPRPLMLALRNTFRRKARVVLTEVTLISAGLVFTMVISASQSFTQTIDQLYSSQGLDIALFFGQNVRIDEGEALIGVQSGVSRVELWSIRSVTALQNKAAVAGESISLRGLPAATRIYQPALTQGRWLMPSDNYAVVLNQYMATRLGVTVGDLITFDMGDRGKSDWTIVGTVLDLSNSQTTGYVPRETLLREIGSVGRTSVAWIRTTNQGGAFEAALADRLRATFEARGIHVSSTRTGAQGRTQSQNEFDILVTLLLVMSALIAGVGGIGLAGTLSLNVLERRREIGVMRAIGASSPAIAGLFIGEGLMLGVLAWALAIPLSIPLGNLFTRAIGASIKFNVIYQFAWAGAGLWLLGIIMLSFLASAIPAMRATQVSVRESLAYE